jgi:hypothetical protein
VKQISAAVRAAVRERAANYCEYCRVPENVTLFAHEPDHIIASQHGGRSNFENLALSCIQCNRCKGPNIAQSIPKRRGFTRSSIQGLINGVSISALSVVESSR